MNNLIQFVLLILWVMSWAIATGWSFFFSLVFPPYGLYVTVNHLLGLSGVL